MRKSKVRVVCTFRVSKSLFRILPCTDNCSILEDAEQNAGTLYIWQMDTRGKNLGKPGES